MQQPPVETDNDLYLHLDLYSIISIESGVNFKHTCISHVSHLCVHVAASQDHGTPQPPDTATDIYLVIVSILDLYIYVCIYIYIYFDLPYLYPTLIHLVVTTEIHPRIS